MDEIVRAALKKWPNVAACYGWLALDARGEWYLRDARTQAAGSFPAVKGSRIEHPNLRAFIARNYGADASGCWFFQNGPQRVYVDLEAAPWVWRVRCDGDAVGVHDHCGAAAEVTSCWLDEHGRVFLGADRGLGIVHSQDMLDASNAIEARLWRPQAVRFAELPLRFGYRLRARDPGAGSRPPASAGRPA